jgi:hypothetical protein
MLTLPVAFLRCHNGPANFDEWILRNLKSGMDQTAAASVRMSCRKPFPDGTVLGTPRCAVANVWTTGVSPRLMLNLGLC